MVGTAHPALLESVPKKIWQFQAIAALGLGNGRAEILIVVSKRLEDCDIQPTK